MAENTEGGTPVTRTTGDPAPPAEVQYDALISQLKKMVNKGGTYVASSARKLKKFLKAAQDTGVMDKGKLRILTNEVEKYAADSIEGGYSNKAANLTDILKIGYDLAGDTQKSAGITAFKEGVGGEGPSALPDFLGGDWTGYQEGGAPPEGTPPPDGAAPPVGEDPSGEGDLGWDAIPDSVKESWRKMGLPDKQLVELANSEHGATFFQLMTLQSALEGRGAVHSAEAPPDRRTRTISPCPALRAVSRALRAALTEFSSGTGWPASSKGITAVGRANPVRVTAKPPSLSKTPCRR